LQPNNIDAAFGLAKALIAIDQPEKARPLLEHAVKEEPFDAVIRYQLAMVYCRLGSTDDSRRELADFEKLKDMKEKLKQSYRDMHLQPQPDRSDPAEAKYASSTPWPRAALHSSCALADHHQLVGGDFSEHLFLATRPANFDIRRLGPPEAEVQAPVAAGEVTRLADHPLRLPLASVLYRYPRADRAAVRLGTDELDLQPPVLSPHIVA
jgi:tetratricopeptide (TPR) repeat protein